MTQWITLPNSFPADAEQVWVRALPEGTAPFLATFNVATLAFQPQFGGAPMPWYYLGRWRPKDP